jgi:hypothetical protein
MINKIKQDIKNYYNNFNKLIEIKKNIKDILKTKISAENKSQYRFMLFNIDKLLINRKKNNNFHKEIIQINTKKVIPIKKNLLTIPINNINNSKILTKSIYELAKDSFNIYDIDKKFYQHLLFDHYLHEENGTDNVEQLCMFLFKIQEYYNNIYKQKNFYIKKLYDLFLSSLFSISINKQIKTLYDNGSILLLSGYLLKEKPGHAIILYIEKNLITNNYYDLYIFNSGLGVNHYQNNNIGIKFTNISVTNIVKIIKFNHIFRNIKNTKTNLEYIIKRLNKISSNIIINEDADEYEIKNIDNFYKILYSYLDTNSYSVVLNDKFQLSGSCSFYSIFYFIKYYFNQNRLNFNKFHNFLKEDAIKFISEYKGSNKNILTLMFLLKKDYDNNIINNDIFIGNIINKIEEKNIIWDNHIITTNNNSEINNSEIKNIIDKSYGENKNIIDYINNYYNYFKIKSNLEKNSSTYYKLYISTYSFYNIIYDYFVRNRNNVNLTREKIKDIINKINKIYIIYYGFLEKYILLYTTYDFFITSKIIILDYCISNNIIIDTEKKYNIKYYDTDTIIFIQPMFIETNILYYLENFSDDDIIFESIFNIKLLQDICDEIVHLPNILLDSDEYIYADSINKLKTFKEFTYNFKYYKKVFIKSDEKKFNILNENNSNENNLTKNKIFYDKYKESETKIINILNSIINLSDYNETNVYNLSDYNATNEYNFIIDNQCINYSIFNYFINNIDFNTILLNLNNYIINNNFNNKKIIEYIFVLTYIFKGDKDKINEPFIENIINSLGLKKFLLLFNHKYNDFFSSRISNIEYLTLINFIDNNFIVNITEKIDSKLTNLKLNIHLCKNLKIKYNFSSLSNLPKNIKKIENILDEKININIKNIKKTLNSINNSEESIKIFNNLIDKIDKILDNINTVIIFSNSNTELSEKLTELVIIREYLDKIKKVYLNKPNNNNINPVYIKVSKKYIYVYDQLLIKKAQLTNNIFTNFIYFEDYPDIFLYKYSLIICGEYYNIITKSSNNLINLWKYNLLNGYLLEKDNKTYIFLMVNKNFIDLLYNDQFWINNIKLRINIDLENKYYLIELNYTLLFPLINDDIELRNEKLIVLFLSLIIAKNNILPLFFYNMINIKYINDNKNNKLYELFIKIIDNNLIDSPFKLLYLKKFKNEKDNNVNYNYNKRKEYFNISKINNYKNDYTIKLEDIIDFYLKLNEKNLNKFKKNDLNIEINYNNIFNKLFIENNIISLEYLYDGYYNEFYNIMYKTFISELSIIKDKNTKDKFMSLIYLDNFERCTEDIFFEIHSKKIINKKQKEFIQYIDNRDKFNEVQQLLMGTGKTSVITPLIILKYYYTKKYSNFIIVLPDYLVNQSYNIINSFMNIINNYDDDFNSNFKEYNIGYYCENKIFITSDSVIKKNILNNIYNQKNIDNIINTDKTYFIYDEIDSLINPLKSDLNIPIDNLKHPYADKIYKYSIIKYKEYRNKKKNINYICNDKLIEINNKANNNVNNNNLNNYLNNQESFSNINNEKILTNKIDNVISKLDILKYNKDYGFGDYINCYDNEFNIKNTKNYFLAIPYNYIDSPVNCSEFSDFEFLLIFTINSYIENGKLREYDILLIYELFYELSKISKTDIEFKYSKLNKNLKIYNKDIVNIILGINKDNKKIIEDVTDEINSLLNIEDIIYSYIESIIYPIFFKISCYQYNISTVDVLGESFSKNKITFSGTVDFQLPEKIIKELFSINLSTLQNEKINNALSYCLNDINIDIISEEKINNAFYGETTKIILFENIKKNTNKNIENCLLDYLFKDDNIIIYDSLIDIAGFFIKTPVVKIVIEIYNVFKKKKINKNIIYLNKNNEKMMYDGVEKKYNNEINDIFIYYDHKHTIGIDFKQPYQMLGLVTINNTNTLTEVVQGIYRLRNIGKGHRVNYFYNKNNNDEKITLKYIYNKLVKNGKKRKEETKSKMQYQCIKYLDRTINKLKDNYYENIFYDNYKEHIFKKFNQKVLTYQDYINLHVKYIAEKNNIPIPKKILINNNIINTNINIDVDIDIDINLHTNIKKSKKIEIYESDFYIYNLIDSNIEIDNYFNLNFFKKSIIYRIFPINNKKYKKNISNYEKYALMASILANFIIENKFNKNTNSKKFIKNINDYILSLNSLNKNQILKGINANKEYLGNLYDILIDICKKNELSNIIKEINIKIDKTNYYLSPLLMDEKLNICSASKYKNKLFSLLIYNDLRLLLSYYETYNIISKLINDNIDKKINYNDIYIYNIYGKLIYGNIKLAPLLKDSEKLILFNYFFDIEDTINILLQNDLENLYDMLELIEFVSKKYYFDIKELENKKFEDIDFYKLFYINENNMNQNIKIKFIDKIKRIKEKYLPHKINYLTEKLARQEI